MSLTEILNNGEYDEIKEAFKCFSESELISLSRDEFVGIFINIRDRALAMKLYKKIRSIPYSISPNDEIKNDEDIAKKLINPICNLVKLQYDNSKRLKMSGKVMDDKFDFIAEGSNRMTMSNFLNDYHSELKNITFLDLSWCRFDRISLDQFVQLLDEMPLLRFLDISYGNISLNEWDFVYNITKRGIILNIIGNDMLKFPDIKDYFDILDISQFHAVISHLIWLPKNAKPEYLWSSMLGKRADKYYKHVRKIHDRFDIDLMLKLIFFV